MKITKRILCLALSVMMALGGMSIAAFADDAAQGTTATTGKITIASPKAGNEYTIYKIFDVTYNESKTAYSYMISENSEWFGVVKT